MKTNYLQPWNQLAEDSMAVIGLRLMALPWQIVFSPRTGQSEMSLMVNEKKAALAETQTALMMAPLHFWTTMLTSWPLRPDQALSKAVTEANRALISPSRTRVSGNLRRLGAPSRSRG